MYLHYLPILFIILPFAIPMTACMFYVLSVANRLADSIEDIAADRDEFPGRRQGGGTHFTEEIAGGSQNRPSHESFIEEA